MMTQSVIPSRNWAVSRAKKKMRCSLRLISRFSFTGHVTRDDGVSWSSRITWRDLPGILHSRIQSATMCSSDYVSIDLGLLAPSWNHFCRHRWATNLEVSKYILRVTLQFKDLRVYLAKNTLEASEVSTRLCSSAYPPMRTLQDQRSYKQMHKAALLWLAGIHRTLPRSWCSFAGVRRNVASLFLDFYSVELFSTQSPSHPLRLWSFNRTCFPSGSIDGANHIFGSGSLSLVGAFSVTTNPIRSLSTSASL
jgi:hypothetical protein